MLDELPDSTLVEVAQRAIGHIGAQHLIEVADAVSWLKADGVAHVTEVTRIALARALDGRRLHATMPLDAILARFARSVDASLRYSYEGVGVVRSARDTLSLFTRGHATIEVTRCDHLALLDTYAFRHWPDARLFEFLEFLVHPTARQGDEQMAIVSALNRVLAVDRFELQVVEYQSAHPVFKVRSLASHVAGKPKNLVFASNGPKPEIGFADAINNDLVILAHAEHCLFYDEHIGDDGLRWDTLIAWWAAREGLDSQAPSTRKSLGERLRASLGSEPERLLFGAYFRARTLRNQLGARLPALIPQVYLHYDPVTQRSLEARGQSRRFEAQRMDFLLLMPHGVRVVIEVDGQQHYSTGADVSARPSPAVYARTVRADRGLRLAGYEVYRFGGYELQDEAASDVLIEEFFSQLFLRHKMVAGRPSI